MKAVKKEQYHLNTIAGLFLVVVVFWLDHITGPYLGFSLFYLIPIALVTWDEGFISGIVVSILSALCWLTADFMSGFPYPNIFFPLWNASIRLAIFCIVSYSLWKIQNARKMRMDLIHFVVHDLRTPLSGILLLYENIKRGLQNKDYTGMEEMVEDGITSGKRMASLIDSILNLAELESGKLTLKKTQFDANLLLQAAIEQVSVFAGRKKVHLKLAIDSSKNEIVSDYDLIFRIVINILSNAIKVSPQNAVVSIKAKAITNGNVAICIEDEGPGIPQEMAKSVFKKFATSETDRTDPIRGFGLGLAFCKLAVEKLGGRIEINGKTQQGTIVTVIIPGT